MSKLIQKYKVIPMPVKASFWFLICSFLQKGISVITTPIYTRLLSTSEYGQFNVWNSWLGIITIFVSLNLSLGVHTQGLIKFSDDAKRFTAALQGMTTMMVFFWTIIYLSFRDFWNHLFNLTTVQMLSMFAIIWTGAVFNFWSNEQRVKFSYRKLVIVTLLASFAKPILGIGLVMTAEDKVTARILAMVVVELTVYSWVFFVQIKKGKAFFSRQFWSYAFAFNLPLVPHYLSQTLLNSADRIMIERMVGISEAGVYSLAYSLSLIMMLFNNALMQTLSPWIYQKIKDKRNKDIAPIAYVTLVMIAAVNLLLILLAPEAVTIFAPKSYHEAIYIIPPVAMSVFFMYSYDLFAKFAFYYEKTKVIMVASVSGALLNLVLNYIFIKFYGYIAAGYTTLVCFMVYAIVHYLFMRKVCRDCCDSDYPYDTKKILIITIPFLVAGFAFLATYQLPVVRYGIVGVTAILAVVFRNKIIGTVKEIMSLKKMA